VVRNHAGGTRMRIGVLISKVATALRQRRVSNRESDSSIVYDGGAIFGQPHERKPGLAAGSQGSKRRRESRRQGQEGRASQNGSDGKRTDRGSSMAEERKRTSRSEGSSERPGSRDLDWSFSPRRGYLSNVVVWRGPCPRRESAASTGVDRCFGSRSRSPAERGEGRAERTSRP